MCCLVQYGVVGGRISSKITLNDMDVPQLLPHLPFMHMFQASNLSLAICIQMC